MKIIRQRKCRNCKQYFTPDYRNVRHQYYCSKSECRKASKKQSQKKWLSKPQNKDYFKGKSNVLRVQQWREANPGYWRRNKEALQEDCHENTVNNQMDNLYLGSQSIPSLGVLQDFFELKPAVIIGLIATLTGSVLQDDIEKTVQRMQQIGSDILNAQFFTYPGGQHVQQTGHLPGTSPQNPQTIQLGGSSSDP